MRVPTAACSSSGGSIPSVLASSSAEDGISSGGIPSVKASGWGKGGRSQRGSDVAAPHGDARLRNSSCLDVCSRVCMHTTSSLGHSEVACMHSRNIITSHYRTRATNKRSIRFACMHAISLYRERPLVFGSNMFSNSPSEHKTIFAKFCKLCGRRLTLARNRNCEK
jgi:hypothetical protein